MEVLVSLAITSMLLVAVAAAFSASTAAIETNDQFFRSTQAARVAVGQIVNDVRQCQTGTYDTDEIDLVTISAQHRLYIYNEAEQTLQLKLTDLDPVPTYTLAHNVTSATFNSDGHSLAVTVTVQIGDNTVTLSGSAIPRRTLTFN